MAEFIPSGWDEAKLREVLKDTMDGFVSREDWHTLKVFSRNIMDSEIHYRTPFERDDVEFIKKVSNSDTPRELTSKILGVYGRDSRRKLGNFPFGYMRAVALRVRIIRSEFSPSEMEPGITSAFEDLFRRTAGRRASFRPRNVRGLRRGLFDDEQ